MWEGDPAALKLETSFAERRRVGDEVIGEEFSTAWRLGVETQAHKHFEKLFCMCGSDADGHWVEETVCCDVIGAAASKLYKTLRASRETPSRAIHPPSFYATRFASNATRGSGPGVRHMLL